MSIKRSEAENCFETKKNVEKDVFERKKLILKKHYD